MHNSDNSQDARKKKAIWRAEHRGMREMDLLMGSFARQYVSAMDQTSLEELEALISVADQDLFDWLLGRTEVPPEYRSTTFARLQNHQFKLESYDG